MSSWSVCSASSTKPPLCRREEKEEEEEKAPEVGEPTSSSFSSLLGSTVGTCSSPSWLSFL